MHLGVVYGRIGILVVHLRGLVIDAAEVGRASKQHVPTRSFS